MYNSDTDPQFNNPKTHTYHACCCSNPEAHCWLCGKDEAEHVAAVEAERAK